MAKLNKGVKFFLIIFLVPFLVFVGFLTSLFVRYSKWEMSDDLTVCLSDLDEQEKEEIREDIAEKTKTFVLSDSRTDFVVFTKQEVLQILSTNMLSQENLETEDICVIASSGIWQVYIKYNLGSTELPWIVLDFVKDNRETAEIYVREIRVGNIKLPESISKKILQDTNRGIADAIIMLNENRFLGRVIENIELLDDRVVLKGSI